MRQRLHHLRVAYGSLGVTRWVMAERVGPIPSETMCVPADASAGAGSLDLRGVILAGIGRMPYRQLTTGPRRRRAITTGGREPPHHDVHVAAWWATGHHETGWR